jgi:hypothetical protein
MLHPSSKVWVANVWLVARLARLERRTGAVIARDVGAKLPVDWRQRYFSVAKGRVFA